MWCTPSTLTILSGEFGVVKVGVWCFNEFFCIMNNFVSLLFNCPKIIVIVVIIDKNISIFLLLRDKIATGSFDTTLKLWSSETGKCYSTMTGHSAEVVGCCYYY